MTKVTSDHFVANMPSLNQSTDGGLGTTVKQFCRDDHSF